MKYKLMAALAIIGVGLLAWNMGHDLAMWRAGQHRAYLAEQARREKEAAFIVEFEGLMIYDMPDGVLIEDRRVE